MADHGQDALGGGWRQFLKQKLYGNLRVRCSKYLPQGAGQIIATSAEVTLNGGLIRELPQNPLNSGLGIILICPEGGFLPLISRVITPIMTTVAHL